MQPRPKLVINNRRKGGVLRWIPRALFLLSAAAAVAAPLFGAGVYVYYSRDLPEVHRIADYRPPTVSSFFAADGRLLGEFTVERRVVVPIEAMPRHLIEAFLAAEDKRFFEHGGIDYISTARAVLANYRAGETTQGASTITQQLCKTLVGNEKSYTRKIREAILARRTEAVLTKLEILHLYLNQVYLGHGAYGVQAAAQNYFRKDVGDLTLAESAMLAGLPPQPGRLTPVLDWEGAKRRQKYVLDRLVEEGFVDAATAQAASAEQITVHPVLENLFDERGPYFTEHVRRDVQQRYGYDALNRDGLRVYMTVDADLQQFAQDALREGLLALGERQGYTGSPTRLEGDKIDEFLKKSKVLYGGPAEIVPDRYYLGVVTAAEKERATVRVGDVEGLLPLKGGVDWAAPYDPKGGWNNRKIDDVRKAVDVGDVVVVRKYRGDRYNAEPGVVFALSQEPRVQGALVSMDPHTGYVQAMVGGFDYDQSEYNRAFQGCRQPGSVFKPIVYSLALEGDYTLATPLDDTPIAKYDSAHQLIWKPKNYEGEFKGDVLLRNALVNSMNVPSIRVIEHVGADRAAEWAKHLGITTPMSPDPSLVLGASCVYPWDMVNVYATFALRGLQPRTAFVKRVEDRDGKILEDRTAFNDPWAPTGPKLDGMLRTLFEPRTRRINTDTAYLMQTLLRGVVESGTGGPAQKLGKPAGGKTGTTDAYDAWFVAFTESLVTGVWVGADLNDRRLGSGETGGKAALPIWLSFMQKALDGVDQREFTAEPPPGIEVAAIDYGTGLLAAPGRRSISLPFKSGTVPNERVQEAGSFDIRDLDQVGDRF